MITWISNVVTGRYQHWNDTNNTYISFLLERSKEFPPAIEPLFTQFTLSSYTVVDFLVGPDKGSKRIIKIDPKTITSEQFRLLHNLNIWTFVALFGRQNPQLRDSFYAACRDFIGLEEVENGRSLTQTAIEMEEIDISKVCLTLYPEITCILKIRSKSIFDELMLTPLFTAVYSGAVEAYKKEIEKIK